MVADFVDFLNMAISWDSIEISDLKMLGDGVSNKISRDNWEGLREEFTLGEGGGVSGLGSKGPVSPSSASPTEVSAASSRR